MTWRHFALGAALMMALTTTVLTQNPGADLQRAKQREATSGDCKSVLAEVLADRRAGHENQSPSGGRSLVADGAVPRPRRPDIGGESRLRQGHIRVWRRAVHRHAGFVEGKRYVGRAWTGESGTPALQIRPRRHANRLSRVALYRILTTIAFVKDGMHLVERDLTTQRERVLVSLGEPSLDVSGQMVGNVSKDGRSFATVIGFWYLRVVA